jgi:hypothetical protein
VKVVGTPSEEAPGDYDDLVARVTRIEAFSVGAFAIAISLLVLEICLELAIRKGAILRPTQMALRT